MARSPVLCAARDISKAIKRGGEDHRGKDVTVVTTNTPGGTMTFSQIAKGQQLQPDLRVGLPLFMGEAIERQTFHEKLHAETGRCQRGSQDDLKGGGKDAEICCRCSLSGHRSPSEGNKEFVKTHRQKYGSDPGLLCGVRICGGYGA